MPTKGRKFLTQFLLPNLNSQKFGSRLKWLDVTEGVFQLQWNHKGAASWRKTDAGVFIEWDKMKGHYKPNEKGYYTHSKQRFRAILNKLINDKIITKVCAGDKHTVIYCLGDKTEQELIALKEIFFHPGKYILQKENEHVIEDHRYSQYEKQVVEECDDVSAFQSNNNNLSICSHPTEIGADIEICDENYFVDEAVELKLASTMHVNMIILGENDQDFGLAVAADFTSPELGYGAVSSYNSYEATNRNSDSLWEWDLFKESISFLRD